MRFHVGCVENGIDGSIGEILSWMVEIDVIPCKDIIEKAQVNNYVCEYP
jgi:hypothetical protein